MPAFQDFLMQSRLGKGNPTRSAEYEQLLPQGIGGAESVVGYHPGQVAYRDGFA